MSRPEDIPESVWKLALVEGAWLADSAREFGELDERTGTLIVARAILAERARMQGAVTALRVKNDALRKQQGTVAQLRMDAERRERGIALDRDHWRGRAQHAEAVIRASGLKIEAA